MPRRRRSSPPVLARISSRAAAPAGPRQLTRGGLEACRRLLERLGENHVIAIAGGDTRHAIAVGLATAAAAESRRAALVEADLARPRLAASLGLAEVPGLAEYLRARAEAGEILQPLMLAGPAASGTVEHLVCVVGGAASPEAEVLLRSDGYAHAIARIRSAYELTVVAAPPDHRDGSLLAVSAQADLTIACCTEAEARGGRWNGLGGVVVVE